MAAAIVIASLQVSSFTKILRRGRGKSRRKGYFGYSSGCPFLVRHALRVALTRPLRMRELPARKESRWRFLGFSIGLKTVEHFPEFMRSAANRIATSSQSTPGVEGYVYGGVGGSQMAFWTCHETANSASHAHDYDEYMVVVQGRYTLIFGDIRVPPKAGEEYFIPRAVWHGGEVVAGTRTIHAFGGRRAQRNRE
jgi:mannose-6-phosphate isomerase-like protein (cupin superfamily)